MEMELGLLKILSTDEFKNYRIPNLPIHFGQY